MTTACTELYCIEQPRGPESICNLDGSEQIANWLTQRIKQQRASACVHGSKSAHEEKNSANNLTLTLLSVSGWPREVSTVPRSVWLVRTGGTVHRCKRAKRWQEAVRAIDRTHTVLRFSAAFEVKELDSVESIRHGESRQNQRSAAGRRSEKRQSRNDVLCRAGDVV